MRTHKFQRLRHTIINVMLIAMIALLYCAMSGGASVPATGADIIYKTENKGTVALECVIAWDGQYIAEILDILRTEDARISFVVQGSWADRNRDMLRQIISDGHSILTCGMNYEDTASLSQEELAASIKNAAALTEQITGSKVTAYYCPTDDVSKAMRAAKKAGFDCVRCTVDLLSARGNSEEIKMRAKNSLQDGSIVAFTPTAALTEALSDILAMYRKAGLSVCGVEC